MLTAAAGLVAYDIVTLHPYEYIYLNRLGAGGQTEASTRFETDYWGLSYKEGLDWLAANYPAVEDLFTIRELGDWKGVGTSVFDSGTGYDKALALSGTP